LDGLQDGPDRRPEKAFHLLEAGTGYAIASKLGLLPQGGYFRDLPGAWQAGARARVVPNGAESAYDFLPMVDVGLRKLWLGDEDAAAIRNSEYFGASLGAYFAYDFKGDRDGLRPMGSLTLGKYWMPIDARPWGLDLNLDLTTLKLPFLTSGHLTGHSEQVVVTVALNFFYALR
jgi:hypothetical protein